MADAGGLVVLLNQDAGAFAANVIAFAVDRLLRQRRSGGRRFPHIHGVLLFQERPIDGPRANVILYVSAHTTPSMNRVAFQIMSAWNGGTAIEYGHLDSQSNVKAYVF